MLASLYWASHGEITLPTMSWWGGLEPDKGRRRRRGRPRKAWRQTF